jgi:hypothetical protein
MKILAESWIEDDPVLAISTAFHDEVEEHDEVDEAQDGCGGVQWWLYVLKKAGTSNKMLHELAREIRGVEQQRGRKLTVIQYKAIFRQWEVASTPFFRPDRDYFTELLAKLDCVNVPKGQTLKAAFERAKQQEPPSHVLAIPNRNVRLFASLCRELYELGGGGQPIMLHQMRIAELFGHSHHRNVSNWIRALKTLGILKLAAPARNRQRAARYFYVATDGC